MATLTRTVINLCVETLNEVKSMSGKVHDAVSQAIEEKALEQGNLTSDRLKELLAEKDANLKSFLEEIITSLRDAMPTNNTTNNNAGVMNDGHREGRDEDLQGGGTTSHKVYQHSECWWHVPKGFTFPD